MSRQLKYNAQFNNAKAVAKADGANYYVALPQTGSGTVYTASKGDYAVCTGYYTGQNTTQDVDTQRYWLLQTTSGMWLLCDTEGSSAWLLEGNTTKLSSKTQAQSQALVNTICKNNRTILSNNLLCARFASKLTKDQKTLLYNLQTRLEARNEALQDNTLTSNWQAGTPSGYKELEGYLTTFMSSGGVGSVTVTVSIIIACVVLASVSTAAYFAFKYYAEESADDVKYSDELTKTLTEKLTTEEYQQLLEETKGIVSKATIKAKLGSNAKYIGIAALIVGGFILIKNLRKKEIL